MNFANLENQNNNLSDENSVSSQDIYNKTKLYIKYLSNIKLKLDNSIESFDKLNEFEKDYNVTTSIYEDFKKEWFYLSNGDNIKLFRSKIDDINEHKKNFYEYSHLIECVAKLYSFDNWYNNCKNKTSITSSNSTNDN